MREFFSSLLEGVAARGREMTTLVLSPRGTDDANRLAVAAEARGWSVAKLPRWRVEAPLAPPLVLYGEPLFCRVVAAQVDHVMIEPPHDWLLGVPAAFAGRRIRYERFDALPNLEYPAFIKPPDDKIFPAQVYAEATALAARDDIAPDQRVLVSEPVRFTEEHRVHVLDGAAVSVRRYAVDGDIAEGVGDDEAAALAAEVARVTPDTPPAVVIDVGRVAEGGWAVVEANPAFGAGTYGADASAILDVLAAACLPRAAVTPDLERFTAAVELE